MLTAISVLVLFGVLIFVGRANVIDEGLYIFANIILSAVGANIASMLFSGILGLLVFLVVFVGISVVAAGFFFDLTGTEKSRFLKTLTISEVIALGSVIAIFATFA